MKIDLELEVAEMMGLSEPVFIEDAGEYNEGEWTVDFHGVVYRYSGSFGTAVDVKREASSSIMLELGQMLAERMVKDGSCKH